MDEKFVSEDPKGGVSLQVRVQPKASRNSLKTGEDGSLRVSVTAPAVDNEANQAVCAYLAKMLGIAKRDVTIKAGEHSRTKTIHVANMSLRETLAKLGGQSNK
jgi:uncharacterized protein (TIGR00251 family)